VPNYPYHYGGSGFKERTQKAARRLEDLKIYFDDLNGGRIPIANLRVEQAAKFLKPTTYSKPSIVVISDTGALEQS
jgi:hypothetical protein